MDSRQVVGHVVPPLVLPAQGGDILVVDVQHIPHLVPGSDGPVDIPGDQLGGQVPRPPSHAKHGAVQNQIPLGLDPHEHLGVGKGQLQIVVAVEAHLHPGVQVFIDQVELPGHLVGEHTAQGVHNIKGEGVQPAHLLHQPQQLQVGVERRAHRLQKHLIPLVHQGRRPGKGLFRLLPVEGQPDTGNPPGTAGWQPVRRKLPLPQSDHRHEHGPALPVGQQGDKLLGALEQGGVLPPGLAGEEPALDDVNAPLVQLL